MDQRPIWVVGFVIMALGYAAQSVALHLGSLNEVQPLMVSELVILVFILWLWFATPLRPRDLAAALATALGLGLFLAISAPTVGHRLPSNELWLVVGVTTLVVGVVLVLLAARGPLWWRALLLGAGASVGFALVAAITKSMTNLLIAGWSPLFSSWQLYALCAVGLGSFLVMQSAFQVGPFAASQSALILLNPLISIVIGHALYGENLRGGALHTALEALSLIVLIVGALGLSTSSLVAKVHEETSTAHLLKGRGRYARRRQRRADL
jgi:drug/metabolite transporter (DMT)-like permease